MSLAWIYCDQRPEIQIKRMLTYIIMRDLQIIRGKIRSIPLKDPDFGKIPSKDSSLEM